MASPPALTQVAFAAGIDEAKEPELLDPMTSFPVLGNGRQERRGGYGKRLGTAALGRSRFDATSITAGARLLSHGDTIVAIDGTVANVYDEDKALWQNAGRVPDCSVSTKTTQAVAGNLLDLVHCNGYLVTLTWVNTAIGSNDFVYVHVETVDGVVVRKQESIGAGMPNPSAVNGGLVTYGNIVIALHCASGTNYIEGNYLDCTSAATVAAGWQALGNLKTDKTTTGTGGYLFSTHSLTSSGAVAYVNNSGGASQVTVFLVTTAGVGTSQTVNTSSVKPEGVGLGGSTADALYVAWNESTAVKMIGLSPTALTTSSTTATVLTAAVAPNVSCPYILHTGAGTGHLIVTQSSRTSFRAWTAAAAMSGSGTTAELYAFPAARPFTRNSRLYQPFKPEPAPTRGTANAQAILCDFTDVYTNRWIRPIAQAYPGQHVNSLNQAYANPWIVDSNHVTYAFAVQRSLISNAVVCLVNHDFDDPGRWDHDEVAGTTYISGGIQSVFDGASITEAGFLHSPPTPTVAVTGTGITGTDYRYVAVFETVDAAGNAVTSGVSSVSAPISPANQTVTVTMKPLAITQRLSMAIDRRVVVSIFRTLTGGSPPYYFVRSSEITTSAVTIVISDALSDATISSNRLLYGTGNLPGTNGSGQDRRAFPYATDVAAYNGMVVVLSGSDIWWSGQLIDGEAVWTNPLFQTPVPGRGDGVGLAVQDGTLYAFKADRIYAFAGDPPADNGSSGGLGTARRLASDVGCINKRSIVVCGLGVFFQSERGIELLDRGGTVSWVGEAIQETLADFSTVMAAVVDERNSLVRISLSNGSTGRDVVYDLTLRAWVSVDDKTGTTSSQFSADACQVYLRGDWLYSWLASDGRVYYEKFAADSDAHLDGSTWVTLSAETGYFKVSGVQGKQFLNKLLVLERYSTDHNLAVSLSYNYETTYRSARTFTRAEINALLSAGWPITQLKHEGHDDAECQSVRVKLVDATPTGGTVGNGKGATWLALTLDLTPKPGAFEVPEGAT
jgi:hypothetical protein